MWCYPKVLEMVRFCSSFPEFKTKLYTDAALSQVSHRKVTETQQ
jgi:hypothetical protein